MTDPDTWFTDSENHEPATHHRRIKQPNGPKEHPLIELAKDMRKDLSYAQGKLTELVRQMRDLGLEVPEPIVCPTCRWDFRTRSELEIHVYHHHNGPLPTAWTIADQRAQDAA